MIPELVDLRGLDWNDTRAVSEATSKTLAGIAEEGGRLRELAEGVCTDASLLEKCEEYDILRKMVIAEDAEYDVRLRLHVFLPGYIDRPHNHRWTYASMILAGSYTHQIYGADTGFDEGVDVDSLKPLLVRHETPGSHYALHNTMVHSLVAEPMTVSLVLRGPSVKDRFLVVDKETGLLWWQYGAAREQEMAAAGNKRLPEIAGKRNMSADDVSRAIDELGRAGVI